MARGTLPRKLKKLGISKLGLSRAIGISDASVIAKLRGDTPWWLHEAHAVTEYLQTFDPTLDQDSLFGLKPLPASANVSQFSGQPVDSGNGREEVA